MASSRNPRSAVLAMALIGLTAACGGANAAAPGTATAAAETMSGEAGASPVAAPGRSPAAVPSGSAISPLPSATPAPSASPSPSAPPAFSATIAKVTRDDVRYSWRPSCPVSLDDLRKITMTYWGFDDKAHTGVLVVNESAAHDLVSVFRELYGFRFPIRRMEPVDAYKASDFDSIDADNTSAFNCRSATGSSSWSQHAYGLAVDINPRENPYIDADGSYAHHNAAAYVDRPVHKPGVVNADDRVVNAFEDIGWGWGGEWSGARDYQHFSSNGH